MHKLSSSLFVFRYSDQDRNIHFQGEGTFVGCHIKIRKEYFHSNFLLQLQSAEIDNQTNCSSKDNDMELWEISDKTVDSAFQEYNLDLQLDLARRE